MNAPICSTNGTMYMTQPKRAREEVLTPTLALLIFYVHMQLVTPSVVVSAVSTVTMT